MTFFAAVFVYLTSCSDSKNIGSAVFNPDQPIEVTGFYPDSGGIATPMIVEGSNFGSDTTNLKVYFEDADGIKHQAGLVSSNGNKIYLYVPSGLTYKKEMNLLVARTMPDGTEYEGQAGRQFIYKTQTSVTTVVGQASPDANQPTVGGDIATSTLSAPNYISLDDEDNIFITERHVWHGGNNYPSVTCQNDKGAQSNGNIVMASIKSNSVLVLQYGTSAILNAPAFSDLDGTMYAPEEITEHARVGFNVWDLTVDKTDDLFREYIRKAKSVTLDGSDKCVFVLKGRKILFTALKDLLQNQDNFKQYGVVRGMERWDNLIDWEQELAAIDTYSNTGEFNSLMHVTTFTDGLYATNYYINMAAGDVSTKDGWGFKNNFDPRDMDKNQDNEWGPGHELGHMHQGAINWPSTTESSNNLFSNYVVYKINQWGSRGSSIGTLATYRYAPPTPWSRFMHPRDPNTLAFTPQDMTSDDANKYGLYQGEASEMHMRLNQQLWTYFERIGKKPNTIRKIFEQGRTPEFWLPFNDPGAAQLMYARNVAKAANMDMTEFFDAWGFFIPVSFKLYAYGSFSYTVTQDMINQTLAYMKTFSTKCPPIEYIEDRRYQVGAKGNQKGISEDGGDVGYFETFQNNVKITKTVSYTVSGRTYTVTNGEQAVAFELIKDGKKVWFANRFVFTVPAEADIEGAELYAVQADGQRIKANK